MRQRSGRKASMDLAAAGPPFKSEISRPIVGRCYACGPFIIYPICILLAHLFWQDGLTSAGLLHLSCYIHPAAVFTTYVNRTS